MKKMNEKEAIEQIIQTPLMRMEERRAKGGRGKGILAQALDTAIQALEEIQNYRATGLTPQQITKLEDLEEQGKLLRLQFRVGDRVWDDEFKSSYRITAYSFGRAEDYIDDPVSETEVIYYYTNYCGSITGSFSESEIGKTMFHSEEEAEAALEKMGE